MASTPSHSHGSQNQTKKSPKDQNQLWTLLWHRFPEQKRKLTNLEQIIGYTFQNKTLLFEALTHKSVLVSQFKPLPWNERLEFLGDAVLSLSMSTILWEELDPQVSEGVLSRYRASLVNESFLAQIATDIHLGDCLLVARSERVDQGNTIRESLLADAFEALIGAIYLDSDFMTAKGMIERAFQSKINLSKDIPVSDYKTQLQELVQASNRSTPVYEDIASEGPDHSKLFRVAVLINSEQLAIGTGTSKKRASQEAARLALKKMETTPSSQSETHETYA